MYQFYFISGVQPQQKIKINKNDLQSEEIEWVLNSTIDTTFTTGWLVNGEKEIFLQVNVNFVRLKLLAQLILIK